MVVILLYVGASLIICGLELYAGMSFEPGRHMSDWRITLLIMAQSGFVLVPLLSYQKNLVAAIAYDLIQTIGLTVAWGYMLSAKVTYQMRLRAEGRRP